MRIFVASRARSAKDQPAQLSMKFRGTGQAARGEVEGKDLKVRGPGQSGAVRYLTCCSWHSGGPLAAVQTVSYASACQECTVSLRVYRCSPPDAAARLSYLHAPRLSLRLRSASTRARPRASTLRVSTGRGQQTCGLAGVGCTQGSTRRTSAQDAEMNTTNQQSTLNATHTHSLMQHTHTHTKHNTTQHDTTQHTEERKKDLELLEAAAAAAPDDGGGGGRTLVPRAQDADDADADASDESSSSDDDDDEVCV